MEVRASNGSGGEASASGGDSQHAVTGGVTQVASPASSASAVPLCGVSIADFENLHSSAKNGVRVVTSDGVGWSTIEAFWGAQCLPRNASADQPVTTVLDVGAVVDPATTRAIKAAVWDNVQILFGAEAGRIGKVTAFRPGPSGDGSDDTYVVESLTEGKLDARLMDLPTLGWDAATWPANFLAAKAEDKKWQRANEEPAWNFPTIDKVHHVRLELSASEFTRYADFQTIDDMVKLVILPRCARDGGAGRSYCELLAERSGAPCAASTHFPSWVFKYDFGAVVETLRAWIDSDASPADAEDACSFWFSPATMNQWAAAAGTLPVDWFEVFKTTIAEIGHTLPIMMPWREPANLGRVWCVYEIFESLQRGAEGRGTRLTFLLPEREVKDMLRALVVDFGSLATVVASVALQDAEGTAPARDQIIEHCRDERTDGKASWNGVNGAVCAALREWLAGAGRAELERRGAAAADAGTLDFVMMLGRLLQDQGKLDEAEPLMQRRLEGSEATLGAMHPETLIAVGNLAQLLKAQGKLDEAEPLYLRSLEGREATLGAMHPSTLIAVANLADLLQAQGKLDEAEPLYLRALEGFEATLGAMHPSTLVAVNNLASLLKAQGKLDEAEPLMLRAWEGQRVALGPSHPDTIVASYTLVDLLAKLGRVDEARELCESELAMCRDALGEAHQDTIDFVEQLAGLQ